MNYLATNASAHHLALVSLTALLASFVGIGYVGQVAIDTDYYYFVKLLKSVVCLAALLYWHFVRQSNDEEFQYGEFRCWQVGALLALQGLDGVFSLLALRVGFTPWVNTVTVLLSGLLFWSLYRDFLIKRRADFFVVSAVVTIFCLSISYSLLGNVNAVDFASLNPIAALLQLIGLVLLVAVGLIWAQPKLNSLSEFELLPFVIAAAGYMQLVSQPGYWLWWMSALFQVIIVVVVLLVVVKVNGHISMNWRTLKSGLNDARHCYFCADMDGNVFFVNQAYKTMFGIADTLPFYKISYPFFAHPLLDSINQSLRHHQSWQGETVLIDKAGKVTSVYAYLTVTDYQGRQIQQGWFEDIHEKKVFRATEYEISQKLEQLSLDLLEKQEEERSYFAKELHDEIGQGLTLLKIQLQLPEPDQKSILTVLSEMIDKVRNLSLNLRPAILDDMGLSAALVWLVDRQKQFSQLVFVSDIADDIGRLDSKLEISVFRIAQEAFTNIHKYSHAKTVHIACRQQGDFLHFSIADDGIGFDLDSKISRANKGQSLGLLSLKERAFLINGIVEIHSSPEQGTKITLKAPIHKSSIRSLNTDTEKEHD